MLHFFSCLFEHYITPARDLAIHTTTVTLLTGHHRMIALL